MEIISIFFFGRLKRKLFIINVIYCLQMSFRTYSGYLVCILIKGSMNILFLESTFSVNILKVTLRI